MTSAATRLLSGPVLDGRAEPYLAHLGRLGPVPDIDGDVAVAMLEATGMLGRGGAGFPVGRKWRAILEVFGDDFGAHASRGRCLAATPAGAAR